nr:venom polypeptide precursor [Doratifera vulnerans]
MNKVILLCLIFALFAFGLSAADPDCIKKGDKCSFSEKPCCGRSQCNFYANRCIGG